MKRKKIFKAILALCIVLASGMVRAQQVNTLYFMENVPVRNSLNPAFQPLSNFYLGFPAVGFSQFNVGNNSLTLRDFVYRDGNQTITFLHPNGDKNKFYNALRPTTLFGAESQLNLLDFGFRTGRAYWNFSITEKVEGKFAVPKDFLKLLLYGTPAVDNNIYNLKNLELGGTAYTEVGLGYAKKINDQWSYGLKFKVLLGTANVSLINDNLDLVAGMDNWTLKGKGSINASLPGLLTVGNNLSTLDYSSPNNNSDWIKPSGLGGGVDLGVTFKPVPSVTLSAALIDLGMIRWNKNMNNIAYNVDYKFEGASINASDNIDSQQLSDSIYEGFKKSATSTQTAKKYTTYTSPKLNIGAEYSFLNNKMSLGLLSRTLKRNRAYYEELTASVNARPTSWFNLSASYSVLNGRTSNIGAGLGLRLGFISYFVAADYIPLYYDSYTSNGVKIPVPNNTKGMNVAVGLNFVFGNRKDADKDGVVDRKDKCPETPLKIKVDKKGCPIDTDGDGVPDYLDQCPDTPAEAYGKVDLNGCPLDSDRDGVPNYLDKCLDTPTKSIGFVDKDGCSLDSDGDGVFDYLDKCPNTPAKATVDSLGCPLDKDGDGVPDYLDKCPGTPVAARGMIDEAGCPFDKDSDNVADYLDKCPNTALEARATVDKNGCPIDSDGDGIPDYLDKCPNTPAEARGMVDDKGCPLDTDADGIFDYLDNCPRVAGVISNHGCPEIKKEVKKLFQKALQGIQFRTGVSTIKPSSFPILNQIAQVLIANPTYLIEIQGHTDNVGKPASNLILSDKRAAAVRDYLIKKGVNDGRMTSHGYGDTKPVAENTTTAGKAKNRRVEFVITFEETSFE